MQARQHGGQSAEVGLSTQQALMSLLPNTTVQLLPLRPDQRDMGESCRPTSDSVVGTAQHMTSRAADPQNKLCMRFQLLDARG